jgi:asparagine synthase (glutamine-hydrolysing)
VCGICGKLMFDPMAAVPAPLITSMLDVISHRGPDDYGVYTRSQVGLGHRRLSIIGLDSGHQPLSNEDGTVWITFNGEIYNYQQLRSELLARGHRFATDTDTEVIVHLYEEFGEACIEKLRGMFAFALWDENTRILLLARDRVGIKPLYYSVNGTSIVFGSELKAILADTDVDRELDPGMVDRFLTFFYLPGEETLLRNIYKLAPGSYMVVKNGKTHIHKYWDLQFGTSTLTLGQAETQLRELLDECLRLHMISDVPVGVLLSGGVDSTAILGMATAASEERLSSYTIGFSDPDCADERPYARVASNTFGSEHHEMTITWKDFQQCLPKFVWHMEEPVCEPPAVALYYVSKLASNFVKVLLSGEGGDEAFAGYPNYRNLLWLERIKSGLGPFKSMMSATLTGLNSVIKSNTLAKYAPLLGVPFDSYYYSRTSGPFSFFNKRPDTLYSSEFLAATSKQRSAQSVKRHFPGAATADIVNRMLYVDTKTWLPDDLLVKADKMTMANSVELRVPLLDHKLLEFAAALPGSYKVRGFTTKYVAKRALGQQVPSEIINRKKAGFPVPYHLWMRTEMSGWVRDLLLDNGSHIRAYFSKDSIEALLSEDLRTRRYAKEVFSLIILELWHRMFMSPSRQPVSSVGCSPSL